MDSDMATTIIVIIVAVGVVGLVAVSVLVAGAVSRLADEFRGFNQKVISISGIVDAPATISGASDAVTVEASTKPVGAVENYVRRTQGRRKNVDGSKWTTRNTKKAKASSTSTPKPSVPSITTRVQALPPSIRGTLSQQRVKNAKTAADLLTPTERRRVELFGKLGSIDAVATRERLSRRTIEGSLYFARRKLGAGNNHEAFAMLQAG